MRALVVALFCLGLAIAPRMTFAQAKKPSETEIKKAKAHFKQARAFQDAKEYDKALAEYQASYAIMPLPDLIFNMAQVLRLKGDKRRALAEYKRYLNEDPDGKGANEAGQHVVSLTREIELEEDLRAKAERERIEREKAERIQAERDKKAAEQAAKDKQREELIRIAREQAEHERKLEERVHGDARRRTDEPARPGRGLKIAGVVVGVVGVVAIGVGVKFGLDAQAKADEVSSLDPGDTWDPSLDDDGKAAERNMFIFVGAGSAAAVTGVVLYVLGVKAEKARPAVSMTPDGTATFGVVGSW